MNYDIAITISVAGSRKAAVWNPQKMMWSDFITKVSRPFVSPETLQEYKALPKSRQDDLKDVGGYVGGTLKGGRRRNGCLLGRCLITLDADSIVPGGTGEILKRVSGLGCAYVVYSTRKHEGAYPRLRIVAPVDRLMTAEEYEPVARRLAFMIGLDIFDATTFEPLRFMYWPSKCADSEWVFNYEDRPFLSVDGMLSLCGDWRDMTAGSSPASAAAARASKSSSNSPSASCHITMRLRAAPESGSANRPRNCSRTSNSATPAPLYVSFAARGEVTG